MIKSFRISGLHTSCVVFFFALILSGCNDQADDEASLAEQYQLQLAAAATITTAFVRPENGAAGCFRELGVRIAVRADSGPLPDNITASSIKLLSLIHI